LFAPILAGRINEGQDGGFLVEAGYKVVAVIFFGKRAVARFPTGELAEWRARELNEQAERHPRGYVQYLVQPLANIRRTGAGPDVSDGG
jgi:hypothetical protein